MGVLSMEIEKLNKTLTESQKECVKNQKKVEELQKKLEQQKEKQKQLKEYERDQKKAVENDLMQTFQACFDRDGLKKGYINLRLKTTRDEILNNIPKSEIEHNYIELNYERILNKVKKSYENDYKAKQELLKIELLKEQQNQQKQDKKTKKYKTLITTFFILFNPITIIIYILIWGYFTFATPVFENHKNMGYNQTEPAWQDPTTGEKLTKEQAYNYLKNK